MIKNMRYSGTVKGLLLILEMNVLRLQSKRQSLLRSHERKMAEKWEETKKELDKICKK